jgi:hypothetical protein
MYTKEHIEKLTHVYLAEASKMQIFKDFKDMIQETFLKDSSILDKYRYTELCKYRQEQEIQCILEDNRFVLQVSLHDTQSQTLESEHLNSGIENPSYNQSSAIYMTTDKTLNGKRKIILSLDPQVHWSKFYLVGGIDHNDLEIAQKTVALLTDLINGDAEWDNINDCLKGHA